MEANFKDSITRKRWLGSLISLRKGEVFHNSKISFRIDSSEVPPSFKFFFVSFDLFGAAAAALAGVHCAGVSIKKRNTGVYIKEKVFGSFMVSDSLDLTCPYVWFL